MHLQAGHLKTEIESRRTFAIISHPDAGKVHFVSRLVEYILIIALTLKTDNPISNLPYYVN
jgi:peptide subunit release factor RF-3